MKRKILVFIFTLSIISFGSVINFDKLENIDGVFYPKGSKEPYTGEVVSYHEKENKNLKGKGFFKNGIPLGTITIFYPNGKVKEIRNYKYGDGFYEWTHFYETGEKCILVKEIERGIEKKTMAWILYSKDGKIEDQEIFVVEH
jgi:antitoxin component YwqK of YwqJK toxin-antitoxin module